MNVKEIFQKLVADGYDESDAAKEAQQRTGVSLVTGKPIKQSSLKFTSKGTTYGQQDTLRKDFGSHGFGQYQR